jgi:malate permease and related proteins
MLMAQIFTVLFPIFFIILAGYLYARIRPLDMAVANRLNMEFFTPALLFYILADQNFDLVSYWPLALAGIWIILGSGLVVLPLVWYLKLQIRTFIPPMMFTNTGNMGLPMALFAFGEDGLKAAVILFIMANLIHLTIGVSIVNPYIKWRNFLKTPMIIATLAGVLFSLFQWHLPALFAIPIKMLGDVAIPLMLFSLGVRLTDINLADWRIGLLGGILCPLSGLIALLLIWPWLTLTPLQLGVLISFSVLPPAVINFIFAEQYCQEPQKVASIVLMGNVLSLFSLPLALAFALSQLH